MLTDDVKMYEMNMTRRSPVWVHQTSLMLPLFIEVPVPFQLSERSFICALWVSMLPLSTIFLLDFGTVVVFFPHFYLYLSLHIVFISDKYSFSMIDFCCIFYQGRRGTFTDTKGKNSEKVNQW